MRKVYLKSVTDNEEMLLPVTPFFKYKFKMNIQSQDLYGFGEIPTGSSPKLAEWTLERFFPHPDNNYDFNLNPKSTKYFINTLWGWMTKNKVLLFRYYDDEDGLISHMYCTITGFECGEEDGSKDIKYKLDLREYKRLEISSYNYYVYNAVPAVLNKGTSYTVQEGDTILIIATKMYGDSTKYIDIMKNNDITNPLDLKVGQVLKI